MKRYPVLSGLRVGCVRYLNSQPLIYGLPGVELAHPAVLAGRLREGALDAALVPVFELLRSPRKYRTVRGIGIASDGPVYSVFVAHTRPLETLEGVFADPASLTSVHLFQLLSRFHLRRPLPLLSRDAEAGANAGTGGGTDPGGFGELWIGNQAIDFRLAHGEQGRCYWDLGEAWREWTGLPFVYAVWVLRRELDPSLAAAAAQELRAVAVEGLGAVPQIVSAQPAAWRQIAGDYLTRHIRFKIGVREMAGLGRFAEELERAGFVEGERGGCEWV